jgi:hypothetical protein
MHIHADVSEHGDKVLATVAADEQFSIEQLDDIKKIFRYAASGARFNFSKSQWSYDYSAGSVLGIVQAAVTLGATISKSPAFEVLEKRITELDAKEESVRRLVQLYMDDKTKQLPSYLTSTEKPPWNHQRISFHWMMNVFYLYLAHKPGLGKTRTAADATRGLYDFGHVTQMTHVQVVPTKQGPVWGTKGGVLILCPKVVLGTWQAELMQYQGIQGTVIRGDSEMKRRRALQLSWAHICTYGSMKYLLNNTYDLIVADEGHVLANDETELYQIAFELGQRAKRRAIMSGTPIRNRMPSIWSQYYWLDGGRCLGSNKKAFMEKYFDTSCRPPEPKEGAEDAIIAATSRITYYLRKEDALPDMPKKLPPQAVYVTMTQDQKVYYERVRLEALAEIQAGRVTTINENVKLIKLFQICQGWVKTDDGSILNFTSAKLDALKDMVTGDGDLADRKVVVWCRFKHDVEIVCSMLNKQRVPHLSLTGDTSDRVRDQIAGPKGVWNLDYRYRVFVGMIQMGIGINLHAKDCLRPTRQGMEPYRCSATIYYGTDYSPVSLEQSSDRTHRGDQVEECLYRYILCSDLNEDDPMKQTQTADVKVYKIVQSKMALADKAFYEGPNHYKHLIQDDLVQ